MCVPLTTCIDIMRQQTVSVVCVLARAKRYQVITQSIAKYACMLPECNAMLPTAVYTYIHIYLFQVTSTHRKKNEEH